MTPRASLARILVASLARIDEDERRRRIAALAGGRRLDGLAELAERHGVGGAVFHALRAVPGVDPAAVGALETIARTTMGNHLGSLGDLALAKDVLDRAGIPWLVFKGPVLAEDVYERPDLRGYNDLDLLVPAEAFSATIEAFEHRGFAVLDRNWRLIREQLRGQLHVGLRHTVADVHWHVVNRGRERFNVQTTQLLDRARPLALNGIDVRTLEETDALLHLALHACLSGCHRLVWLADVDRWIQAHPPVWDDLIERSRSWNVGSSLAITLARVRRILGTPVPSRVLATLPQRPMLDRLTRPEGSAGELSRAVAKAASRDARWKARRLWIAASRIPGARNGAPRGILAHGGDEVDRVAFMEAVARAGDSGARRRSGHRM